jgi:hypothetical protein
LPLYYAYLIAEVIITNVYLTKELSMSDLAQYLKEGRQYLMASCGKEGRPSTFSNAIRYNLMALSIEKNMMAILAQYNDLADNHTFSDMISSVERHIDLPTDLKDELLALESLQTICSVIEYHRAEPDDDSIARLSEACKRINSMAESLCITE